MLTTQRLLQVVLVVLVLFPEVHVTGSKSGVPTLTIAGGFVAFVDVVACVEVEMGSLKC